MRGPRIVGRIGLIAATAVLVVGGAACSSGDDNDADTTTGTQTITASPTTAADDTTDADDDADQDPDAESGDRSRGGAGGGDGSGRSGDGGGASPTRFTAAEESYLDWVGQREGMSDDVARSQVDLGYQVCARVAQGKEDHEIIAEIASQVQGPSIAGAAVGGARQFLCPTEGATRPDDG